MQARKSSPWRTAAQTTENSVLDYIPEGITLLPNTSGARNAEEALRIARLAREVLHRLRQGRNRT